MEELEKFIKRVPKAELHVHLDGSALPKTLHEFSKKIDWLPTLSLEEFEKRMRVPDACRSLPDYLATFQLVLPYLQTREILEQTAYDMMEQASADNVKYMEVRFSPGLHLQRGLTVDAVIDSVLSGLKAGGREFGIETGLIICGIREKDPALSLYLAEHAAAQKDRGVVAVDLAGNEVEYEGLLHKAAFDYAFNHGLHITVHAGEAQGVWSIKEALEKLHAERIGHGIRLYEDEALVEYFKEQQIPLEVCPTSNVQTRTVKSIEEHPAKEYLEKGLKVTLNTDSRTASNVSLTEEYLRVAKAWDLTKAQVARLARNSFESAFLNDIRKKELINKLTFD